MTDLLEKYPENGQMVFVRQRPAIVREVVSKNDPQTNIVQHLIDLEYIDGWNFPREDFVIWEREINPIIFSKIELPNIRPDINPDKPELYDAFLNAIRWSTLNRVFFATNNHDSNINYRITSPWYSSIQIEDYQLYPVLKALQMPRVRLLLADDVGLGKTIEAGLILTELINQRRIRRVLIISPASIQIQWQEEMSEKFNLNFKIINRDTAFKIKKELGMDTNPWRTVPRIITSMDYIRQPNIFSQFKVASENIQPEGSASLPWDLIIVDEAHNFMPSAHGPSQDSQRSKMLREIAKIFEHRLFLTATPHNGFTTSFTGLLEILDPLRFTQKPALEEIDHKQIKLVMIRRLKSELNSRKLIQRFSNREVKAINISLEPEENELYQVLRSYRKKLIRELQKIGNREVVLGKFIFSLFKKRLLSSSYSFAKTWWSHIAGFNLEEIGIDEAEKSREIAESETQDDNEKDNKEADAVRHGAACFHKVMPNLSEEINEISENLKKLGLPKEIIENSVYNLDLEIPDSKFDALINWIDSNLIDSERLVIFTEYRDTQNYLIRRLNKKKWVEPKLRILFGGAPTSYREDVKAEFNNPNSKLRILIATDTASEGLNLQKASRYIIHQDIPWNPMRLEQRNGRLDRYGQARDVKVYHFVSDEDEDLRFLSYIVKKTHTVREDLGSTGKVLDAAILHHFEEDDKEGFIESKLDEEIDKIAEILSKKQDLNVFDTGDEKYYEKALNILEETKHLLNIKPENIGNVLNEAIKLDNKDAQLLLVKDKTTKALYYRFSPPPKAWENLIDNRLKIHKGDFKGSLPKIFFDDKYFQNTINGRVIFEIPPDSTLIRIGHPLIQKSLTSFRRLLWSSNEHILNRWTIQSGDLPISLDMVGIFSCVVSIRNSLGELIDSYIEEMILRIEKKNYSEINRDDKLHQTINNLNLELLENDKLDFWKELILKEWSFIQKYLNEFIEESKSKIEKDYKKILDNTLKLEISNEEKLLKERLVELKSEDKSEKLIQKLEQEKTELEKSIKQTRLSKYLFEEDTERKGEKIRIRNIDDQIKDLTWERDSSTLEILKNHLQTEHERVVNQILPKRYSIKSIDIFPVGLRFIVKK